MKNKHKILITEDNFIIALSMEEDFKEMGYDICGKVTTGEDAIEAARKCNPDLIFMDVLLASDMDGIEAAHEIKKFKDIPIVFLTGYKDDEIQSRIDNFAPAGYLLKPTGRKEIESIINSICTVSN